MAQPIKMPPERWAKLIDPTSEMDSEEEEEVIGLVLDRLRELTAILIFRLSDTHSESVSISRHYRHDLVRDMDKLWDKYGAKKMFGGDDDA